MTSASQLSTTSVATIGNINVSVTLTWSISGTPHLIGNDGHEKVDIGGTGTLQDKGVPASDDLIYHTATLTNVTVDAGNTNQAKAAVKGHAYSGTAQIWTDATGTAESPRHAIHAAKVNSNYLANEDVAIGFSFAANGDLTVDADHKTILVCVGGGSITWGTKANGTRPFTSMTDATDYSGSTNSAVQGYVGLVGISQTA